MSKRAELDLYGQALWERAQALAKLKYLDPRAHAEVSLRAYDGEGTTEQIIADLRTSTALVQALIARAESRPASGERPPSADFVYGQVLHRIDAALERLEPKQRPPFEARLATVRARWGARERPGGATDERARTEDLRPVLAEIEALAERNTN